MSMNSFFAKVILGSVTGTFLESKYGPSSSCSDCKRRLFALAPLILIGTSFWSITHGMVVGKARAKAIEDAKADGEENVEDRYDLPNLYAQGISKHAKIYNSIQRSHQHIFESFTQAVLGCMVGAIEFPITAAACSLMYAVGRISLSNSYAKCEGDPSKRYASKLAFYQWYGLMGGFCVGAISCIKIFATKKIKN
jgi:hypothetical protein